MPGSYFCPSREASGWWGKNIDLAVASAAHLWIILGKSCPFSCSQISLLWRRREKSKIIIILVIIEYIWIVRDQNMNSLASSKKPGHWCRWTVSVGGCTYPSGFLEGFSVSIKNFRAEKVRVLKKPCGNATVTFLCSVLRAKPSEFHLISITLTPSDDLWAGLFFFFFF